MNEANNVSKPQSGYRLTDPWSLLKNSFNWYKANFKAMIFMILAMVIPIVILTVVFTAGFAIADNLSETAGKVLTIITGAISAVLIVFVIYYAFRAQLGLYLTIKNPTAGFKANYQATKKLFWSGLGVSLLSGLLVLAWSLLLIIPGIIFWVFYSLAFFIFVFEGTKGYQAIKASKELVKGYWWSLFGRYLYFGVLMLIISLIASIPQAFMVDDGAVELVYKGIIQIVSYVLTPWFIVYAYLIYRDLKHIKSQAK